MTTREIETKRNEDLDIDVVLNNLNSKVSEMSTVIQNRTHTSTSTIEDIKNAINNKMLGIGDVVKQQDIEKSYQKNFNSKTYTEIAKGRLYRVLSPEKQMYKSDEMILIYVKGKLYRFDTEFNKQWELTIPSTVRFNNSDIVGIVVEGNFIKLFQGKYSCKMLKITLGGELAETINVNSSRTGAFCGVTTINNELLIYSSDRVFKIGVNGSQKFNFGGGRLKQMGNYIISQDGTKLIKRDLKGSVVKEFDTRALVGYRAGWYIKGITFTENSIIAWYDAETGPELKLCKLNLDFKRIFTVGITSNESFFKYDKLSNRRVDEFLQIANVDADTEENIYVFSYTNVTKFDRNGNKIWEYADGVRHISLGIISSTSDAYVIQGSYKEYTNVQDKLDTVVRENNEEVVCEICCLEQRKLLGYKLLNINR